MKTPCRKRSPKGGTVQHGETSDTPKLRNEASDAESIRIRGARQNNLRGVDLDIPAGKITVVTGVSGSGKSSLVFDTVYAEGQRRYVETFSPYARQFLDRLPPPLVDSVDGIPPAIAIRQGNPVRNSRSTVGTMTELHDHVKQLFASCARLFCPNCGREIVPATPDSVFENLVRRGLDGRRAIVSFEVEVPASVSREDALALLSSQGFTRVREAGAGRFRVDVDAVRVEEARRARLCEALETAFSRGRGAALVVPLADDRSESAALKYSTRLECPECGEAFEEPSPNLFSFNSPVGACPHCRGFGRVIGVSEALVVPEPRKSIAEGCVKPFQTKSFIDAQRMLVRRAKAIGCPVDVPWEKLPAKWRKWVWDGETDDWESGLWPGVADFFRWLESRTYKLHVRVMLSRYREYAPCPECGGTRLRPAARAWRLVAGGASYDVPSLDALTVSEARAFLEAVRAEAEPGTPRGDAAIAVLDGVLPRLRCLEEAGAGYLALDRPSRTLSGGEAQRIALTTALGSNLVGTLFVLDEPSVGLHPRDIDRLVGILRRLRDAGNTILVVEHDPALILAADRVVELGPGPGENGGTVVFQGSVPELLRSRTSVSAPYLRAFAKPRTRTEYSPTLASLGSPLSEGADPESPGLLFAAEAPPRPTGRRRTPGAGAQTGRLTLLGATEHNLKDIDVSFPLGAFTVVTGVSGSGKSTLVCDVLFPAVRRALGIPTPEAGACRGVEGAEGLAGVELVDQSPIGKSARSTPASYVGAFDAIRALFAATPAAKAHGVGVGDFSFNYGLGRCPACEGSGFEHVEMQFLSDVYLPCEVCGGTRYRPEILAIRLPCPALGRDLSVADALQLTVTEALAAFADDRATVARLRPLADVGLGYLRLGQPVPTLSGGEAQRLKLAGFLAELGSNAQCRMHNAKCKGSLLLFDEPTTGLHFRDIDVLLGVFRRLVRDGHTIVAIEHNVQVMRAADLLVDLGPDGGDAGGRIVAQGSPEELARPGVPGATAAALRG
jgi:excinuclease ABC subunit A